MRVLFINNNGAGWADYVDVPSLQPVHQFFEEHMPDQTPEDYLIRVNRQPVPPTYVLQENDRVTITPVKIHGGIG